MLHFHIAVHELAVVTRHIVDRKPEQWLFPNFVNNSSQPHHFRNNPAVPVFLPTYFCRLWGQKRQEREKEGEMRGRWGGELPGPPVSTDWLAVIWILEEMRVITNSDLNISLLHAQLVYQKLCFPIYSNWMILCFPSSLQRVDS